MNIKRYFDNNWESAILSKEKQEQINIIQSFILKYGDKDKLNYFEFGCGNCYVTNHLFENLKKDYRDICFHVSDISKTGLDLCDNKFKKTLVTQDKMDFSHFYNSMNIVSSFEVFEHLSDELEAFYLNELLQVSKQYLIIGVPYQEKLEKRDVSCASCGYKGHIYGHLRSYDIDRFSNIFGEGARLLEYKLCGAKEIDFKTKQYRLAHKFGYKILNFTCPVCVQDINYVSLLNRIRNKVLMSIFMNSRISSYDEHPFWIVGVFKKVNYNEKK